MLTVLANKMKYDTSYDFAKPDQIEQEFLQYRKVRKRGAKLVIPSTLIITILVQELSNLFRKIVKMCPDMSVSFVSSLVRTCFSNLTAMPFADVEVSLHLLGLLGEAATQVGKVILT